MPAAKIERLSRQHALSVSIHEAIARTTGVFDLYQEATRIAVQQGEYRLAWVGLEDPAQALLVPVAHAGHDDGYVSTIQISTDRNYREGLGPGGTAFRTGEPAVCNDIASDRMSFAYREEALMRGYRSCAAVPLRRDGRPIGIFVVYSEDAMHFDADELALLSTFVASFSFAVDARQREEQRAGMERALRASEARLRAVIENEPECVKSVSLEGVLQAINRAGLLMLHADSAEQLVGRPLSDLVHPADVRLLHEMHARAVQGNRGHTQLRAVDMRGRVLWMDAYATPLRSEDGRIDCILYVTRDITEQRASLQRLEHKQALLRMASRLGRIGAWEVELPSQEMTWSDELAEIFGIEPGRFPSFKEVLTRCSPQDREAVASAFQSCAIEGIPFDLELAADTADGRRLSIRAMGEAVRDEAGSIFRVQGAFQDITERKRSEDEIRDLAQRLATTLESITDALVTVDSQWRFTYVNREAERLLRRNRNELLGTDMWKQFPEGVGTPFERAYNESLATGRTVEIEEFYPPLGTWLEVRAYPSPRGGLTVYFRDSGERHAARQEIVRLNAELEHRVQLRTAQLQMANQELEAFSYSVAHDLRAPLAAISGFGHALEAELADAGPRARHYLERVRAGAELTSEMIGALLSLAQLSRAELRWEPVDLSAMALDAVRLFRAQEPGRTVQFNVQPGLVAHGDPRLLQLVIDNLLANAWKFTARTALARIDVGAHADETGQRVFWVRDNGVGFDPAFAGNLFGAFQRLHTQSEFPGSGIGLANVRRIISRHSGRVWATSRPGEGATFSFVLGEEPA